MKVLAFFVVAIGLIPSIASAGQIYGSIMLDGRGLSRSVDLQIACEPDFSTGFQTDGYGSYRVFVPRPGRCTLTAFVGGRRYDGVVYSYDGPVRYDFELMPDGRLRRR